MVTTISFVVGKGSLSHNNRSFIAENVVEERIELDEFYIQQHENLIRTHELIGSKGLALKFITTSQRYYFFIMHPQHQAVIEAAIKNMLSTAWNKHFMLFEFGEED